jgi:hypothetical protein
MKKKKKKSKIRIPVPQRPPKVEDSPKTYNRKKDKQATKKSIEMETNNE